LTLSSRDVSFVPAMAVVAAVCHIAMGPIISRTFHVPGPVVAGPVIMAPIMVAGAVTRRRGTLLLTSAINGLILALFVPIGLLALPVYIVTGLVLELLYVKSSTEIFQRPYSFLASGLGNTASILLIATIGLGMRSVILLSTISIVGFVAGGVGGLIASSVMLRVSHIYPSRTG
jgi:hypothetical protein